VPNKCLDPDTITLLQQDIGDPSPAERDSLLRLEFDDSSSSDDNIGSKFLLKVSIKLSYFFVIS